MKNVFNGCMDTFTGWSLSIHDKKKRKTTISYLGLKPLSASRRKGKTENKTCSLVKKFSESKCEC